MLVDETSASFGKLLFLFKVYALTSKNLDLGLAHNKKLVSIDNKSTKSTIFSHASVLYPLFGTSNCINFSGL